MSERAYSASELARLLPELGKKAAVARRAVAEGWPHREERGRGGARRVYPLAGLPPEIQARLIASRPTIEATPDKHLAKARERLELMHRVVARIEAGDAVRATLQEVARESGHHESSIRRWYDRVRDLDPTEWLAALTPGWKPGGRSAECHEDAWRYFRDDYLRGARPALSAVYERTVAVAKAKGWTPVPSLKALTARLRREVPYEVQLIDREGREALARLYPAQQRSRAHFRALEAINADGHRFDVMVRWPDGEVVRPLLLAWQDLYSGKILAWRIDRTENADVVRLSFGDVVERYGVPEHVWLDNGRGFASKWITGGARTRFRFKVRDEDPVGVVVAVGVKDENIHWTTPYHGQSKPIERAFRELCEHIARHPSCEGAYTGNSPVAKPHNYGSRTVELDTFVRLVSTEIETHNAREGRDTEVCDGRSFDQVFAESYARGPIRRASEAQRRLCLLAAERVRVRQGTGLICLFGNRNRYWHPALAPLQGESVIVRFDPDHLKSAVHVYRPDGTYVCAADYQGVVGFDDRTQARDHNRRRAEYVKAWKRAAKAERHFTAADLGDLHLGVRPPEPAPTTKVIAPNFGAPSTAKPVELEEAIEMPVEKTERGRSVRRADGDALVAELGRAAMSSGRIRPRRASNE